jgi:hypothetical protein
MFEDKKIYFITYNLSPVWLFLATVTCYFNCLDRVVLAHHSEHWLHFQSVLLSLAVGQIQYLPWVQNGLVGFKKNTTCKKQYMCWMMTILCQWDFSEQTEKLVRLLHLTAFFHHQNCTVSTSSGSWKLSCSASTGNYSFSSFISSTYSEHWKTWMKWQHNFFQNPLL